MLCIKGGSSIQMRPNEVYGIIDIATTPNKVYGVNTDGIDTAPNMVYAVSTSVESTDTTPNVVYEVIPERICTLQQQSV